MTVDSNPTPVQSCDVVVIGGGPAGTTLAALVREQGFRVVLFEKDRHPRFHIGESLLPMNLPILERLGVLEQVRRIGVVKPGAEFGAPDQARQTIYFSEAMDKRHPYAFQVRRSEFDQVLFENCATKGVLIQPGVRVNEVTFHPDRTGTVEAVDEQGREQRWQTRFVVDASGRDTFLARKLGLKRKNAHHQSAAIFGHFQNVERLPGQDAGNISIYLFAHGWFWMIPLHDGAMSVGAVCLPEYLKTRRTSPEAFLWQTIELCPGVQNRMRRAELVGEARATGNYSYRSSRLYGDGYLLIGDAFAFVDPLFSTGVLFAMNSAVLGAEAVTAYLRDGPSAIPLFQRCERQVRRGIDTVSWFIYRFTSPAMQHLFMAPRNNFRIKEAIISMLAGDVFRNTPIMLPLTIFKLIYYLTFAARFSPAWAAYRRRKRNAALEFAGGTTPQDRRT